MELFHFFQLESSVTLCVRHRGTFSKTSKFISGHHEAIPAAPTFLHSLLAAEQYYDRHAMARALTVGNLTGLEQSAFRVPHPSALLGESLQEIMARLLFSIVHWVRHLPSFRALPSRDQVFLIFCLSFNHHCVNLPTNVICPMNLV